jgi:hypothetical protein
LNTAKAGFPAKLARSAVVLMACRSNALDAFLTADRKVKELYYETDWVLKQGFVIPEIG